MNLSQFNSMVESAELDVLTLTNGLAAVMIYDDEILLGLRALVTARSSTAFAVLRKEIDSSDWETALPIKIFSLERTAKRWIANQFISEFESDGNISDEYIGFLELQFLEGTPDDPAPHPFASCAGYYDAATGSLLMTEKDRQGIYQCHAPQYHYSLAVIFDDHHLKNTLEN